MLCNHAFGNLSAALYVGPNAVAQEKGNHDVNQRTWMLTGVLSGGLSADLPGDSTLSALSTAAKENGVTVG